ncbi:MAG: hypothetical protein WCC36_03530 [Gammaproteobacteria bacterium]
MKLVEGQIYEGPVSAFGGEAPLQRWMVVAPFGKMHCHSISDPLDLHCMPLAIAEQLTAEGRLSLADTDSGHPVLRLQRRKEALGIHDAHLGLRGENLERMLALLERAVADDEDYTPYAAGEVLSLLCRLHSDEQVASIRTRVERYMSQWRHQETGGGTAPHTPNPPATPPM